MVKFLPYLNNYIVILILLFLSSQNIRAQVQDSSIFISPTISQERFITLKKEVEIRDSIRKILPKNNLNFKLKKFERKKTPILNLLAKFFIIVLALALVFYIVFTIFSNIKVDKKLDALPDNLNEVEDISKINTRPAYENAIDTENYRLAIRMQFIKVLQILSEKELIDWRPFKTNRDYRHELNNHSLSKSFQFLALIYDNAWYGNKVINKETFESYDEHFQAFINYNDGQ